MKIEDLLNEHTAWLTGTGPESDIVLSSRVRLARNLEGKTFPGRASDASRREVLGRILEVSEKITEFSKGTTVRLEEVGDLDRQFLVERRLISRELSSEKGGAVVVGEGETSSLMINEEDHLRIQVLRSGLNLTECWETADRIDTELGTSLRYEFSPVYGHLTACPTNVGTGMRASVMLHLPALVINRQIGKILQAVNKLGLAVRGAYGEGTRASGNIFQTSNQLTLGKTELAVINDLEKVILKIVNYERQARSELLSSKQLKLEDRVFRAWGVLKNARIISSEETIDLLSGLRMGVNLGMLSGISRGLVNEIFVRTQPAHLQKQAGRELPPEGRDILRADIIREKLAGVKPEPKNPGNGRGE